MTHSNLNTKAVSPEHSDLANAIRALSMDAVEKANSGHPGMPMGMADVATVLFTQFLKFDPQHPDWPDRDRFILSAGHGSMLLYSLLYLTGYKDFTLDQLKNFRQLHSITAGHPEYGMGAGIETTTGPLGQGLGNSVGMALAEKILQANFSQEIVDHYTYVIAGDGCLMEGISHESISLAGHLKLNKLIVLFDDNEISIDGPTSLAVSDNQLKRFEACGWDVQEIDGHNPTEIAEAIRKAQQTETPSLIACKTTIAYGAPTKSGTSGSHGAPLGAEEIKGTRDNLNWPYDPFVIPEDVLEYWRSTGNNGHQDYLKWENRFSTLSKELQDEFLRRYNGDLPSKINETFNNEKQKLINEPLSEATRKSSERALTIFSEKLPELVGGSADLTGSNNTKAKHMKAISADNFDGHYIYYGVREHAMAAAMNGMALHKGFIPFGGTFLTFTDYCRPSIRLSALMKQRVIYVMTHDSIGLGEDGPTHQPVEHVASLRAMPNVNVFRPADAVETLECWQLAILDQDTPSVLALSRQSLPQARLEESSENLCQYGAYVLREADFDHQVTLFATGSEISIALEAREALQQDKIGTRVVSVPSWELFDQQSSSYKKSVLAKHTVRIAVEAGCSMGWEKFIGLDGSFVGMSSFGESAPAKDLYNHFNINKETIVKKAKNILNN